MEKTDFPGGLELIRREGVGGREAGSIAPLCSEAI